MLKRDHTKLICDIGELSELFSDATSLENFLQQIVEMISDHMQCEVCSIYLYYDDQQELILEATKGLKKEAIHNVRMKLGEGLTGLALKELRAISERNASQNSAYRYFPEIGEEAYESFLAVPIVRGQTRIGVIVIQNLKKDYFNEEDVRVFRAITSQLANTIETAKLLINLNTQPAKQKTKTDFKDIKFIKGRAASEGFAWASAMVFEQQRRALRPLASATSRQFTVTDFHVAVESAQKELESLQNQIEETLVDVASLIFTAQILMLKDKPFIDAILAKIQSGINAPDAVVQVVEHYVYMFDRLPTEYLREKRHDMMDIGSRLLHHLVGWNEQKSDYEDKIIIAQELFPSDILKLFSQKIKGVILLSGGITSHVAILARSLEIPLIIVDAKALLNVSSETKILLDAEQGNVYVDPAQDVINSFLRREEERAKLNELNHQIKEQTVMKDGTRVRLLSNINLLSDLKAAHSYKSEGVGLYRTEFPFIVRSDFPSEEEQFFVYQKLVEGMPGKEIVFRTLDIGGDKVLSYYDYGKENNPFLGMRSIRFSLKHKDIFQQQLRAILRAGVDANLSIMFPMISSLDEFRAARAEVLQCVMSLKQEGIKCHAQPKIGMMVELPSVLEIINELAREADFFSIGTNDFIQYMLAVDRTNEKVADLYMPHHPAILRALKKVVDAAQKHKKDVSICGDMAHNEKYLLYFLGIGVRKFSIDSHYIPKIQHRIEGFSRRQAVTAARNLLKQNSTQDLEKLIS